MDPSGDSTLLLKQFNDSALSLVIVLTKHTVSLTAQLGKNWLSDQQPLNHRLLKGDPC